MVNPILSPTHAIMPHPPTSGTCSNPHIVTPTPPNGTCLNPYVLTPTPTPGTRTNPLVDTATPPLSGKCSNPHVITPTPPRILGIQATLVTPPPLYGHAHATAQTDPVYILSRLSTPEPEGNSNQGTPGITTPSSYSTASLPSSDTTVFRNGRKCATEDS